MASSGNMISVLIMAASMANRSQGCSMTLAASTDVLQTLRLDRVARTAWYSFMDRPASRINHTGVQSTGSRRQAFKNRSFIMRDGILDGHGRTCQFQA